MQKESDYDKEYSLGDRLGGYFQYSLSNSFISYICISDKRCYYERFQDTIDVIVQQHAILNNQEGLPEEGQLLIDTNMPLNQLISTPDDAKALEKVLNKIVNYEEIQINQLPPQEKASIENIVKKVDHHNKQKGVKPTPGRPCPIALFNRQRLPQQTTYTIKPRTRIKDILTYFDKKSNRIVKPISIKDQNGYKYTEKDIQKKISELAVFPKNITIYYPPIFTLVNNQPFKIHLINSVHDKPTIMIKIGPNFSLLEVVQKVREVTKDRGGPKVIQDREQNILSVKDWRNRLCWFQLRSPQLTFTFAPFQHFECQLVVRSLPNRKQQNYFYKVMQQTTLGHIVQFVRKKTNCFVGTFQITDSQGRIFRTSIKKTTLSSLHLSQNKLQLTYLKPKCLLRSSAMLALEADLGKIQLMSIKQYLSEAKQKQLKLLSYDHQNQCIERGLISCFKSQSQYARLYNLKIEAENQILFVDSFEESTFCTSANQWKPASSLKHGDQIKVLNSTLREVIEGKIIEVIQIGIQPQEELYAFEVLPHHNFFANRVMFHNDDSIKLTAYIFKQGQPTKKQQINCYLNQSLKSIESFRNKVLMIGGGLYLQPDLTCGDYQLDTFGSVFVFEEGEQNHQKTFVISEWGSQSYQYNQVNDFLKNKWQSDYFGVYQSRIVELNNLKEFENNAQPLNLLVCPKLNLEKLYYTFTIRPQYSNLEKQALEEYDHIEIPSKIINNEERKLQDPKDIRPLYLYTLNLFYYDLNVFLRTKNKSNYSLQDIAKWYSITNCIVGSLQKLRNYSGVVYRGLSNICIDKAFRIKQSSDKQQYLILQGFTSTTTDPDIAQSFIKGKGALLKLIIQSGKEIEDYSDYPEKEVLLPPYLYFRIVNYNLEEQIQEMTLEQIPFPQTTKRNLIFWVDDNPKQEENMALLQRLESHNIEVVQVSSTKLIQIILRDFLALIQAMGKKVVILSDMSRIERGIENSQAGDDLFKLIYDEYGKSTRAFIFVGHEQISREQIEGQRFNTGIWQIYSDVQQLLKQILLQFES